MKKQIDAGWEILRYKTFICGADCLCFAPMLIKVHTYVKIENNQCNHWWLFSVRLIILTGFYSGIRRLVSSMPNLKNVVFNIRLTLWFIPVLHSHRYCCAKWCSKSTYKSNSSDDLIYDTQVRSRYCNIVSLTGPGTSIRYAARFVMLVASAWSSLDFHNASSKVVVASFSS